LLFVAPWPDGGTGGKRREPGPDLAGKREVVDLCNDVLARWSLCALALNLPLSHSFAIFASWRFKYGDSQATDASHRVQRNNLLTPL